MNFFFGLSERFGICRCRIEQNLMSRTKRNETRRNIRNGKRWMRQRRKMKWRWAEEKKTFTNDLIATCWKLVGLVIYCQHYCQHPTHIPFNHSCDVVAILGLLFFPHIEIRLVNEMEEKKDDFHCGNNCFRRGLDQEEKKVLEFRFLIRHIIAHALASMKWKRLWAPARKMFSFFSCSSLSIFFLSQKFRCVLDGRLTERVCGSLTYLGI